MLTASSGDDGCVDHSAAFIQIVSHHRNLDYSLFGSVYQQVILDLKTIPKHKFILLARASEKENLFRYVLGDEITLSLKLRLLIDYAHWTVLAERRWEIFA